MDIDAVLTALSESGNLRVIPEAQDNHHVDLSSNDYLGLAMRKDLRESFFNTIDTSEVLMSASASRLLASCQDAFSRLEATVAGAYGHGRDALIFNSGYHANSGIIPALCDKKTYIIADRLVHASIIDGIRLGGASFTRFRHNDYGHLRKLTADSVEKGFNPLIIAESVYSMDGDRADIGALADVKRLFPESTLYVDEAHAVGVEGPRGLGLCEASGRIDEIDVIVGTFGKALASTGAFALVSPGMKQYLVNRCRSLIFSTAIPPLNVLWTNFIFEKSLAMDMERDRLYSLENRLHEILSQFSSVPEISHIQPLMIGNPLDTVALSGKLRDEGFNVLPIRTPTVPPGTDRLRFSLSADISPDDLDRLESALLKIMK